MRLALSQILARKRQAHSLGASQSDAHTLLTACYSPPTTDYVLLRASEHLGTLLATGRAYTTYLGTSLHTTYYTLHTTYRSLLATYYAPRNISAQRKTSSNSARCACARLGAAPGVPMTCLPASPKRPKRMPGGRVIASSVLPAASAAWT